MTAETTLPDWMTPGAKVIVVHTGRFAPTVRRGHVSKTLARDLVISEEARNETTRDVRVWRDHFIADDLGGHYDRADYSGGAWSITHIQVYAHDHPRAVALEAAAVADVKIHFLEEELQELRKARGSRDRNGGLYPTHRTEGMEFDLADRAALLQGQAKRAADAITRAMSAASSLVALERAAKDRAKAEGRPLGG